ncbi:MBL fold metallo-hydrolase [Naasia sp. SYSU D00948]|uniref:MBL fold metallo-hydrolase n=1 Tax=Naasia sp. SYSU D00948 TaxID=2817379 RepID=UPI001B30F939|nr:MBL fold metallo-hydrolase [Naasia sp. SYSU D00948]
MPILQRTRSIEDRGPTLLRSVAPGVHRLSHAHTNSYLIEDGDALTIVDALFPTTWRVLQRALDAIGFRPAQVRALVLTHAHFDHLGVARRMQTEWDLPIWAHPYEGFIARHPYRYAHENPRSFYPIRHPKAIPILSAMTAAGAWNVRGVEGLSWFSAGDTLEVPGRPVVVFSPGHTFGHSALHLPDRNALITGDALVTLDPYTGETGPRIVAGAATADSREAMGSLEVLAATGARLVLPGHGVPWREGIGAAVTAARAAGPA